MTLYPRVRPLGDTAFTVELGGTIDPATNAAVRALDGSLRERPLGGVVETVPTHRSLLVIHEWGAGALADLRARVLDRVGAAAAPPPPGPLRTVPTLYGGEYGEDLAEVARGCGLSEAEVVGVHTSQEYTAFMLGFMPGFPYLGLSPPALEVTRRATPRTRVPPGSVALAGRQCGIYPAASPGGWRLVGRCGVRLFDPEAVPPTFIEPGDRVRFVASRALASAAAPPPARPVASPPALEVLAPGLLTTIQAGERRGHRRLGVPGAGPVDPPALAAANRAVGNAADAAALEITLVGPELRFVGAAWAALAGADLGAVLLRADLGPWPVPAGRPFLARPGNVLRFQGRRAGCRAYLALLGGIDVPLVLGSASADLTGGFGGGFGRALRAGDVLCVVPGAARPPDAMGTPAAGQPVDSGVESLRVLLGPQDDLFPADAVQRFLETTFAVSDASDRVGCRLIGPSLAGGTTTEIVSDGMVPGSVQVPPDGQPIVTLADGPTTGGYPKIATVLCADLPRLAQLVPGRAQVRFEAVRG